MKNAIVTTLQRDPALEDYLVTENNALKNLALKNGRHFAKRNLPAAQGDSLEPYTGDLKAGYERIHSEVERRLQAQAALYDAKVDAAHFKEKGMVIDVRIAELEHENHNDQYELEGFDPSGVYRRLTAVGAFGLLILIGEILFNTKAFLVVGENLLFALLISIGVSTGVFLTPHYLSKVYDSTKHQSQRLLIIVGSLLGATAVFTVLAILRSSYLEAQGMNVSPVAFVVVNLFLFIVTALLSRNVQPDWEMLRGRPIKLHRAVVQRNKTIARLRKDKDDLMETIALRLKYHNRLASLSMHYAELCKKMHAEAVAAFKRTNLLFRSDRTTPDCFYVPVIISSAHSINNDPQ